MPPGQALIRSAQGGIGICAVECTYLFRLLTTTARVSVDAIGTRIGDMLASTQRDVRCDSAALLLRCMLLIRLYRISSQHPYKRLHHAFD